MHLQQKTELKHHLHFKNNTKYITTIARGKKKIYTTIERHIKNAYDKSKQELNATTVQSAKRS